jgi:hypothetical protein
VNHLPNAAKTLMLSAPGRRVTVSKHAGTWELSSATPEVMGNIAGNHLAYSTCGVIADFLMR